MAGEWGDEAETNGEPARIPADSFEERATIAYHKPETRAGAWFAAPACPPNLPALYARAQADLAKPVKGMLLEWSFLHAKSRGRLARAERVLADLEVARRCAVDRMMSPYPPTEDQRQEIRVYIPAEVSLDQARDELMEATSWVQATEHVMAHLRSAVAALKAKAAPPKAPPPRRS